VWLPLRRGMLAAAARLRPGAVPYFELTVSNADKGTLPLEEVRRRAAQFAGSGGDGEVGLCTLNQVDP
jgi:hypothetical protein